MARPPHAVARRSAAASLEAVSSTYSSFPAAPLLASSDGICPSLTRAVQQAVNQPPAGDEVPSRWLDVRDRTRAATHARVERCRVLVEEAKAARIPEIARRGAGRTPCQAPTTTRPAAPCLAPARPRWCAPAGGQVPVPLPRRPGGHDV